MAIPKDGGPWLPIHVGLLDDDRWSAMTPLQMSAWITLYLQLDREPEHGVFRTTQKAGLRLVARGWSKDDAYDALMGLVDLGWFVEVPGGWTILRWDHYTGAAARKSIRNAARPPTREGRRGATHAPVEPPSKKTRRDDHFVVESPRPRARGAAGGGDTDAPQDGRSLAEKMGIADIAEVIGAAPSKRASARRSAS